MYSPLDLEVHQGLDGRYYLLDFSRLFPPEALLPGRHKNSWLSKLLRPELVARFHKPLCSDTYSPFVKHHNPQEPSKK